MNKINVRFQILQRTRKKIMYEYSKVVNVVDGDTVDVDDLGFGVWMRKQRIRMYE